MMSTPRRLLSAAPLAVLAALATALPLAAAPLTSTATSSAPAPAAERVILIGVDGGDGRLVEQYMDEGRLPNMARLREQGSFARLGTQVPNESPTAWAALNSGRNPGETGVAGFIRRNLPGGMPAPGFGHLVSETGALEDFESRPLFAKHDTAKWTYGGGAAAFVAFFVLFKLLLRMRALPAFLLSAILGGVGGYAGGQMRGMYPDAYPRYTNPQEARNFWDVAGEAGVRSIVLDSAQSFDAESPDGVHVLHGLGVPDARGGLGDWIVYTDSDTEFDRVPEGRRSSTAGRIFKVDVRDGKVATKFYGPKDFARKEAIQDELDALNERKNDTSIGYKESQALRAELAPRINELETELADSHDINYGVALDLTVEPDGEGYAVAIGDQRQTLAVGEWSDFYELTFDLNPMLKVHGVTRLKIESMEPEFRLFINTLDIAPEAPPFWQEISAPADFSSQLASSGTFETYGWACMTMPFKDGEIEPETLLEDIEFTLKWRERVTFEQLARNDWQLLMSVFSTPDRVQHMFYQYYDEGHPLHDPAVANRRTTFFGEEIAIKDAIPKIFEQVDRIVGRVMDEVLQDGDILMMCADHGLQSFRYQVHINNLLHDLGYLALKPGATVKDGGSLTRFIDWKNTKAYAMGLGYIYLNVQGREKNGIVKPDEMAAVSAELSQALLDWRHPETGEPVVEEVYTLSEIHSGEFMDRGSDLVTGFMPYYRVSWKTNGGKMDLVEVDGEVVAGPVIVDNTSNWSGGHPSVAEHQVRGLFFSSVPMDLPSEGPNLLHIAPTVLDLLGVEVPAEMDKAPLKPAG